MGFLNEKEQETRLNLAFPQQSISDRSASKPTVADGHCCARIIENQTHGSRHPWSADRLDDAARITRAAGATGVEFIFMIAVGILFGMNDERAAVFVKNTQTPR